LASAPSDTVYLVAAASGDVGWNCSVFPLQLKPPATLTEVAVLRRLKAAWVAVASIGVFSRSGWRRPAWPPRPWGVGDDQGWPLVVKLQV